MTTATRNRGILIAAVGIVLIASVLYPHELPFGTLLYGVLYGGLSGVLAIGLVVTYRVTRAINFAYGAMGGVAASVAVSLYLGHHWPWLVAVGVALVVGGVVGLAVGALVSWRFADAPRLVLTVATIGLSQLLGGIAAFAPQWLGGPRQMFGGFETGLSKVHVQLRPVLFNGNDVLVMVAVPSAVAFVSWLLLRTDAGRAVRAIADNQDRVRLLGVPARRLLLGMWTVCGVLAGLAAVLQAPSQGVLLNASAGPTLLIAPLVAAVVARMESIWIAFGAAVALGVLQAVIGLNVSKQSIQTVVLLAVVVVALVVQRRRTSRADEAGESTWSATGAASPVPQAIRALPVVRVVRIVLGLAVAVTALSLPALLDAGQLDQVSAAIVFALAALSLVVLSGWGGTVSLGQMALVGVGAVVAGDLMMHLNLDMFQSLAAAGAAGGLVAVVLGVPALRVRGQFLAVTTLAFAMAAEQFFFNPTNFASLLPTSVSRPVLWKRFDLHSEGDLYLVCLAVLAITIALVHTMRSSRPGRVLIATRDNVRGAAATGTPTTRVKLLSFVIAGIIAGVAGGLYVVIFGSVDFGSVPASDSLLVFSTAVIGGLGSIGGSLAGVALVQWLGIAFPTLQVLITGTGVVVILAIFPSGLAGLGARARDWILIRLARRAGLDTSVWSTGGTRDDAPTAQLPVAAATTEALGEAMLSCRGVEASYGSLQVLFGVDLEVRHGEIVALLGTNGAGKSSVLKCVAGLLKTGAGEVTIDGRTTRGMATEELARNGVCLVPGGRGVFGSLTVAENLDVARWLVRKDPLAEEQARARALTLFPVLEDRASIKAGELSGGEQQMLSLAMALLSKPRLLCIDELSLGLSPVMVAELVEAVKLINREGVTVVLVEQSVNVACTVADRAIFLEKGQVRFTGPTAELLERPDLVRAVFLPDPADLPHREDSSDSTPEVRTVPALACRNLNKHFGGISAVSDLSFEVWPGEVVGLIGHNGAGKTTLFDLISGFTKADSGQVLLDGFDLTAYPPHSRAFAGLGRSFQEARLFPSLTVRETVLVAMETRLASRDTVAATLALPASTDSEAAASQAVDRIIEMLGLESYRGTLTGSLSTGTRRIVELACVLAQHPSVLLLDEPSGGVAQAEAESLTALLRSVAEQTGCSVVIIEHDMGIVTSLCDRLVAPESGSVITEGSVEEVLSHPRVIASYLGTDDGHGAAHAGSSNGRHTGQLAGSR